MVQKPTIKWECYKCFKSFSDLKGLEDHFESEHANKPDTGTNKEIDDLSKIRG